MQNSPEEQDVNNFIIGMNNNKLYCVNFQSSIIYILIKVFENRSYKA